MNGQLLEVIQRVLGEESVPTVNARKLHEFLEVGKDFSTWIKDRIEKYDFVQDQDYVIAEELSSPKSGSAMSRPQRTLSYHITLDMAKELSMVERNEKGKQARQYFIECERKVKAADPIEALKDPAKLRQVLLGYTEKVLDLENKVAQLAPKVEAYDRFATFTEGSYCIRDTAKMLGVKEKALVQSLLQWKWVYRRPMSSNLLGYAEREQMGYVEHKVTEGTKPDGSKWSNAQCRITAKGLARLSKLLGEPGDLAAC